MKRIECPKDQWTTLIFNFGTGMPKSWNINFATKSGGNVEGSFIEKRYWWIFPKKPVTGGLKPRMRFQRYWINAIYSLKVCPKLDMIAEID